MKISKKMMPLAVLVAVVVLLAIALAVLSGLDTEEETGLPLFELDPDSVTAVSYQQQDEEAPVDVTLLYADETWTLSDDPTLPLDQETTANLAANIAGLTALRDLGTDAETEEMGPPPCCGWPLTAATSPPSPSPARRPPACTP